MMMVYAMFDILGLTRMSTMRLLGNLKAYKIVLEKTRNI